MAKRNLSSGGAIPMDAGERDTLVTIEELTESVGASRFPVKAWTTLTTAWMRRLGIKGSERWVAQQVSGVAEVQWEMGYVATMDPDLVDVVKVRRLVYAGRVHDIVAADVIGRQEGIELLTRAKVG